jgi:hypothetical protein
LSTVTVVYKTPPATPTPRPTRHYDRSRYNLDRHPTWAVTTHFTLAASAGAEMPSLLRIRTALGPVEIHLIDGPETRDRIMWLSPRLGHPRLTPTYWHH